MGPTIHVENGPFERAVFGGSIQGRPDDIRRQAAAPPRLADWRLLGYATRYNKAHSHAGRVEVFRRGCFATSLRSNRDVAFLGSHTWAKCYGTTGDGMLELLEDDHGLAFVLHPNDDDDGRSLIEEVRAGRLAMSVGYETLSTSAREIDGTPVTFIESATLIEISAVATPAVKETTVTAIGADGFSGLKSVCRTGRMQHYVACANVERGLAKLRELLE